MVGLRCLQQIGFFSYGFAFLSPLRYEIEKRSDDGGCRGLIPVLCLSILERRQGGSAESSFQRLESGVAGELLFAAGLEGTRFAKFSAVAAAILALPVESQT